MREFKPGDRVILDPKGAEEWIDPKLRLRARDRCRATIRNAVPTAEGYRVDFDTTGRKRPLSEIIPARELVAVDD